MKKALAPLVVTDAEQGQGRRASVLSALTFAVWRGDDLVNVGKAYIGLPVADIDTLTRRLARTTLAQRGGVPLVSPSIVLEVAFDGVQPSARHKSGYALRFPRTVRVRDGKTPADDDRRDAIDALFRAPIATRHREEDVVPPDAGRTPKRRGRSENEQRLSLFEEAA